MCVPFCVWLLFAPGCAGQIAARCVMWLRSVLVVGLWCPVVCCTINDSSSSRPALGRFPLGTSTDRAVRNQSAPVFWPMCVYSCVGRAPWSGAGGRTAHRSAGVETAGAGYHGFSRGAVWGPLALKLVTALCLVLAGRSVPVLEFPRLRKMSTPKRAPVTCAVLYVRAERDTHH